MRKSLRYYYLTLVAAICAVLGCTSCSLSADAGEGAQHPQGAMSAPEAVEIHPLIEADAPVGISAQSAQFLYSLSGGQEENCMISPASFVLALQMAEKGASGETRAQIEAFTGGEAFDLSGGAVDVFNLFVSNETGSGAAQMKESYQEILSADHALCAEGVELTHENQDTLAGELNAKISEITNGQIPSAIDVNMFADPDFTALLANVIHFKASWADTDEYDIIEDYKFTKTDGTVISCNALRMPDTDSMRYYYGEGFQVFSVDYKEDDGRYRFYGFLPEKEGEIDLTDLTLTGFTEPEGEYQIFVHIPKFEYSSDLTCNSALYNAGLIDMFDEGRADFSKGFERTAGRNVYVSDMVQKTKIRFDEKGTEASAYTGMMLMTTSALQEMPSTYNLDFNRPFLFVIWDNEENVPLYVGQVYDPTETS